jgi:hypothetical protein
MLAGSLCASGIIDEFVRLATGDLEGMFVVRRRVRLRIGMPASDATIEELIT